MDIRLIILPLDARPVCYQQVLDVAAACGIQVKMPSKRLLGQLKTPADEKGLREWTENVLAEDPDAAVILSLDLLAYGGLIPSRVHHESIETLQARIQWFLERCDSRTIHAFSSILRIPNYNNAEEEPAYWEDHGQAIYEASMRAHQTGDVDGAFADLMQSVRDDVLTRRYVNMALNTWYLDLFAAGKFQSLFFAQDDTGSHGLNVQEAQTLREHAREKNLVIEVQTGADEIALMLMAKIATEQSNKTASVLPVYTPSDAKECLARFDGISVGQVVENKLRAVGAQQATSLDTADAVLFINGPRKQHMGDHCAESGTGEADAAYFESLTKQLFDLLQEKPVMLADVAYANGSDPELTDSLIAQKFPFLSLASYAGWNTPGNTIGTAVSVGLLHYLAVQNKTLTPSVHYKHLLTRLIDDWGYQAVVRHRLRGQIRPGRSPINNRDLDQHMFEIETKLDTYLNQVGFHPQEYVFPCKRLFEIDVQWPVHAQATP